MANPVRQVVTTAGAATPKVVDWNAAPFAIGWVCEVPAGTTASYNLQYTLDDVTDATITPLWLVDANAPLASTATTHGTYLAPVRAIQLVVASISGGPMNLTFIQSISRAGTLNR